MASASPMTSTCTLLLLMGVLHLCAAEVGNSAATLPRLTQRSNGLCGTFVDPDNYDCQEFIVPTKDEFLLGVQRLTSRSVTASKGPAFLYHGIFLGGDVWVINPPSEALAFILADAGYVVWIGNTRTTTFSYGHISYTNHDKEFWDWSVDELALYDVPAMVNFVYSQSNQKIFYIGYSQGTQSAFAALSQGLPLLNVVEKFVMLAPVAYIDHATTPIGVAAVKLDTDKLLMALHVNYFTFRSKTGREIVDYVCTAMNIACYDDSIALLTGENCCINASRRPFYDKYELQATSTKNLYHLAQQYRTGTFSRYDYGLLGNMQRYGTPTPPEYNLQQIPAQSKMMLVRAGKDALSTAPDVDHLLSQLSFSPSQIEIPNYAHLDFVIGIYAKDDVYSQTISFIQSQ